MPNKAGASKGVSAAMIAFYDDAEASFDRLLNIFKVFGHLLQCGKLWTAVNMAIVIDRPVLDWTTWVILILKATVQIECRYGVIQYERLGARLGLFKVKMATLQGDRCRDSDPLTKREKALLEAEPVSAMPSCRRAPSWGMLAVCSICLSDVFAALPVLPEPVIQPLAPIGEGAGYV